MSNAAERQLLVESDVLPSLVEVRGARGTRRGRGGERARASAHPEMRIHTRTVAPLCEPRALTRTVAVASPLRRVPLRRVVARSRAQLLAPHHGELSRGAAAEALQCLAAPDLDPATGRPLGLEDTRDARGDGGDEDKGAAPLPSALLAQRGKAQRAMGETPHLIDQVRRRSRRGDTHT